LKRAVPNCARNYDDHTHDIFKLDVNARIIEIKSTRGSKTVQNRNPKKSIRFETTNTLRTHSELNSKLTTALVTER
jgi:hypothetical protein